MGLLNYVAMKFSVLFILVLLIYVSATAQSKETITKYFDSNWHPVPDAKTAAYYQSVEVLDAMSLVRTYYISGKIESIGECKVDNTAIRNGKHRNYYEDGTLKSEEEYKDGVPVGIHKTYHKNGKPEKEMIVKPGPGITDDVFVHYYTESGEELLSHGNGVVKAMSENDYDQYEEFRDSIMVSLYNFYKGSGDTIYLTIEKPAEYRGGLGALARDVSAALNYPKSARRNGLQGTVFVMFVIDKEGKIIDPDVVKGFDPACDAEALSVVKSLKPWIPGESRGKPANCRFVLPIKFKLTR